jgi:D-serine deaminase-like pyridoxal phosphate-dependent protein
VRLDELTTPALLVDADALDTNLSVMAAALPGDRMRPHVKAHKCTSLARRQREVGHVGFTCATVREVEGMAAAGLGNDLLLANEVVDARRLGALSGARVTVAVDSEATIEAAVAGGVREVVVDVNVGLPRCGCRPDQAGALAALARSRGLRVRGVMGYEGHIVGIESREVRVEGVAAAMELLVGAAADVDGDDGIVSAGGTGTYDINPQATEIQAGSYALMDTTYARCGLPFAHALTVLSTIVSVGDGWVVADCGLKAFGMDHGNPTVPGATVWFTSDEHLTFAPESPLQVGDRVQVLPAHVDPTVAYHEHMHVVRGGDVVHTWPVDLRGW